jgi:copper chaperone NosL
MLTALAAVLLFATFLFPLWRIDLLAPQYPEGLGMLIRVNTITGIAPSDLGNINGLNHYIGMKEIVPEAIPVLRYMPWVLGALALSGLAVAGAGRRAPLAAWVAALAVSGAAGMVEFYLWSYDYGHNLAADAVIKVPGMSYQPPLIGSKQLLNFTASSWPDVGGWLAAIAFGLAVAALLPWFAGASSRRVAAAAPRAAMAALALLLAAASCARSAGPVPIGYGEVDCAVCRMRITDQRYGGEFVTHTGKVRQFDSIECLAGYASTAADSAGAAYVTDFERPGHLLPVTGALFVRRGGSGSPMGAGLLAVRARADTASLRAAFAGELLTWVQVRERTARGGLRPQHDSSTSAS